MKLIISKIVYFIKRHNSIKDSIKLTIAILYYPVVAFAWLYSKVSRKFPSNLWLIGELGIDAKDNGYFFYKYMNENHPEVHTVYYISSENIEMVNELGALGKIVEYNSFAHMLAFMRSKYIISTQDMYAIPWGHINWREFKLVYPWIAKNKKFVFLQHGVTKDDASKNANYKRTKFDYFVTEANAEFRSISSDKYGYKNGQVIETGFPRFDNLYDQKEKKTSNIILFMPTWRQYLANVSENEFENSTYFKEMNAVFENQELKNILKSNNLKLLFFPPHQEIQKFIHLFRISKESNIDIAELNGNVSVPQMIIDSKLMITDYSSVAFDFAFLKKPLIYFQFDKAEYRKGHYSKGYFDYERDGFGPVVNQVDNLVSEIRKGIDDNFKMKYMYLNRSNSFFDLFDSKNSERLFQILAD